MYSLLLGVYLIIVIIMIMIILVQQPKEGGLSPMFGGGMENILGVRGAPTFFTKLTAALGTLYIILSLVLSAINSPRRVKRAQVPVETQKQVEQTQPQEQQTIPQIPEEGGK